MEEKFGVILEYLSMRLMTFIISLMIYVGSVTSALAVTDTLEVITLKHQLAEALIPLVQPLVGDTGVVTGRNDQLIVRTTADRLAQVRTLVKQLDTPPQRLLISVKQLQGNQTQRQAVGISGTLSLGRDVSVIDNDHKQQKLPMGLKKRTTRRGDNLQQQIHVLDGSEAFVEMGEAIPYVAEYVDSPYPDSFSGAYHGHYDIRSQSVTSGFYVRPQVHGDWVTLQILPRRARESAHGGGRVSTQQAATTVTGRLGEWLEVTSLRVENQRNDQTIIHSTQTMDRSNQRILVKVDRLR